MAGESGIAEDGDIPGSEAEAMFRVKTTDVPSSLKVAAWVLAVLLFVAWAVSLWLLVETRAGRSDSVGWAALLAVLLTLATISLPWFWKRSVTSQQALHRVKLLAHDILASMDQGVITTDNRGLITSINSGACGLLAAGEECVGRPVSEIASREIPLDALRLRVIESHEHVREAEFTTPGDEHSRRLLVSAYELNETNGITLGCVIHLRDVTERMRMKEQMWRLERMASLSTLAAGLHHEIKNPLTALSLHVQLLEEWIRDLEVNETAAGLLSVIGSEVRRLNGVLDRFRDFASLQRLNLRPTDVSEILEDVARLIRPQAELQGVILREASGLYRLPRVSLDAEKFHEVVLNLVMNALEAMPNGGELSLDAEVEDGTLSVDVRDTGPGIAEGIRGKLFEPYVSTKVRGMGMGLALVEKLMSQHGGQATYQTGPKGTTFRLTVPTAGVVLEPLEDEILR